MDEETKERVSNRLAADTFMPLMIEAFHAGLREIASLSRWLLATLVVINGAAVIAMLPLKIDTTAKLGAAFAFLFGILSALGAALWSLYVFKRFSNSAGTMMGYWLDVADDGQRLEALEAEMKLHMEQAIGSRGTHALVYLSMTAFLAGCLLSGWGLLMRGGLP
jgi:hypothetical protein